MVDFSKLVKKGPHRISDKDKESAFWLYIRGCDVRFIAQTLKRDWTEIHNMMWDVMRGVEPAPVVATQAALDKSDWSLREEYILRTMAGFSVPPSVVADLLGRGKDQCKRKLREMKERDAWLSDYAIKRRAELTKPDTGGVVAQKPKQGTFFNEDD